MNNSEKSSAKICRAAEDRVTDHRIGKSFYNMEKIMNGDIESIITALQSGPRNNLP